MQQAETPHETLTAASRFLAMGRSYEDLKFSTIMSRKSTGKNYTRDLPCYLQRAEGIL